MFDVLPAIGLVFLFAVAPAHIGQTLETRYTSLVRSFAAGDVDEAAARLNTLTETREREAVALLIRTAPEPQILKAAALLETDGAFRATPYQRFRLDLAESLVQSLAARTDRRIAKASFVIRWYLAVGLTFLTIADVTPAQTYVTRGLRDAPNDPQLLLASGMIEEAIATRGSDAELLALTEHARRRDLVLVDRERDRRRAQALLLQEAARQYEKALTVDDQLLEARLRLGRVLAVSGDRSAAQRELERTIREATDVRTVYLSHLFLGRLLVDAGEADAASREYEAARHASPESQTPYVALAELAARHGEASQAREMMARVAGWQEANNIDPWWTYVFGGGGQLEVTVRWLRKEIHP